MRSSLQKDSSHLLNYLKESLKDYSQFISISSFNNIIISIEKKSLNIFLEELYKNTELKISFVSLFANDERIKDNKFKLYLLLHLVEYQSLLIVEVIIPEGDVSYPSITSLIPQAEWHEREIHDMYGIIPSGIELDPLILHRDWPHGKHFPMRNEFPQDKQISISEVPHEFKQPHGEGMYQIAVGPIHAGIIEPGHLRFCAIGEEIHKFDAQLFYTHKGIEKMAEGKTLEEVLVLAEHVCGMCSYSHSSAFCQAVENIIDIQVPERAVYIRTICLELERLSSHLFDLTAICSAGGLAFASNHAARLREIIMRLISNLTGHRFFRGLNAVGGLKKDLGNEEFNLLAKKLEQFKKQFQEVETLILNSDSLLDRLETTGFLSNENAVKLGIVGPAARASGVDKDIRRDLPYLAYYDLAFKVSLCTDGDALARTQVRVDEIYESIKIIKLLIKELPSGQVIGNTSSAHSVYKKGAGLIESAKGELLHWVMINSENKIVRWHIRSASYMNWRGMVLATMGNNIVPDGPLVNKSFNLCYACVDR